jgi:hypothetical protein
MLTNEIVHYMKQWNYIEIRQIKTKNKDDLFLWSVVTPVLLFEPTWSFYLKFNLSKTIYFLKRTWFLYVLSKYQGMFKILQWNAMLRKAPALKIARSYPRNSLFIGHASNPP